MQLTSLTEIDSDDQFRNATHTVHPPSYVAPSPHDHRTPRRRMIPTVIAGICGIAIGLAGGWWFANRQSHEESKISLPPESKLRVLDVVPINVGEVTYRRVRRQIDAIGSVLALEDLTIASKTTGRVLKLHADLADRVEPGSLLLEVDPTDNQLAVAQSEQSLEAERVRWGIDRVPAKEVDISKLPPVVTARLRAELAKSKFARFESLLRTNTISQDDFDQVKSDFLVSQSEWENQNLMARSALASIVLREADLNVNRQRLVDTKVYAPKPSIDLPERDRLYSVAQRMVSEGTMVRPGDNLFRLVLGQSVKVSLRLQERHSQLVVKGQRVEIEVSSAEDIVFGEIQRVSPVVDPMTRTFIAEVAVSNDALQLKPGGFVKARILLGKEEDVATVPIIALDTFAGLNKIFTIEDGKASEHQVQIGIQDDGWIEIAEPILSRGAIVATSAQRMLSNGVAVSIKNAIPSNASESTNANTATSVGTDVAR